MAGFRCLKSLIRKPKKSRTFLTATVSPISSHSSSSRFSPLSNLSIHGPHGGGGGGGGGPLFLSSPPWKLSQSATPFFFRLRQNAAVLEKIEALSLNNLLLSKTRPPPDNLTSAGSGPAAVSDRPAAEGSFANAPNLISMGRLVSGPVLGWMIINDWYSAAMLGLAVSGASDWLDGYVARRMKINSVVGSYLDPLSDKVLIGCVALAMVHKDLLHLYQRASSLGWKWKRWSDFFNLDGTRPQKVEPLFISKVNTVLRLILVAAALLQPEFGTQETQSYITYLSWLVASTTMASTAAYGVQHLRKSASLAQKS